MMLPIDAMVVRVLGSSSSGNCYIMDDGNEALIIEAGIRFAEVKKALQFNLRKVAGCLVTHQHNDHAKYLQDMVKNGITTLALPEVWLAKHVSPSVAIQPGKGYKLGGFKVLPFPACHDVPCVGYLIEHPKCGRILFLTDSYMCEYTFKGLNHIMVECNYSDMDLIQAIQAGRTLAKQRERLMTSHMELGTCLELLAANDLREVSEIMLLHLSNDNSNEKRFKEAVEASTGLRTYIANPGLVIDIDRY